MRPPPPRTTASTHARTASPPSAGARERWRELAPPLDHARWPAAALALLHLLLALAALNPTLYSGGDNGTYLSLARALAEQGRYLDLWDPARPPHALYPPVFPLLLAGALTLGLRSWIALKLLIVAASVAAVVVSFLWMRRVIGPRAAFAAGLLLAIAPRVLNLSHWVLSDVPFWALSMLALWAFACADDPARPPANALRWVMMGAVAAALAVMTRSAGLPLVVAAVAALLLRRQPKRAAVVALVAGVPMLLWWLRGKLLGGGYTGYLWLLDPYQPALGNATPAQLAARVLENARRYLFTYLPMLLWDDVDLGAVAAVLLVALAVVGWVMRVRREPGVAELWLPLYLGVVLLWPATWAGERLILPVLPVLLLLAAEALRSVARHRHRAGVAAALLVLLGLGLATPGIAREVRIAGACREVYLAGDRYGCLDPIWADFFRLAEAVRGRLPRGSVVISRKPTLFFTLSGYPSRVYPLSASPDTFFAAARAAGARYVVVDQVPDLAPAYLHPVLLARRDEFCVVSDFVWPNAVLLRIEVGGPLRALDAPPNAFRRCEAPRAP